jgi:RHS repeat-associated protein
LFELDAGGNLISREEYHPFGTTSFYLEPSALLDVDSKRYRYTGRERDDETGLYRLGARYYLPWLGRFLSADPAGYVDGANLYRYSRDNPIRFSDPSGTDPNDYQLKSQLLFTGIANPLTLPDYPCIPGASAPQTFELVGSQGANLGFTGSGGSTSLLANYRQRVSERLDLGVTAAYAGQYPWTGGDSTNSNFTGSQLAFFSHFGNVENQALTQTSSGFYFSAGFLWGQGPAGATDATNPFASLTTGLSTFRRSRNEQGELDTDFQLDWNLILTASRYGNSINNRVAEGAFSALTVFNFALPADFNVEVAGGALAGANPILFDPNDPRSRLVTPFTLRSQLGVGWTHQISGNYVFGIEAILTKDWLPSVLDSGGNQGGPLGLTVNIGISGVNRPHHPQDENAELQHFIQERDDALRGGN